MNLKKNINKYLISLITIVFLFTGVGCSDSSSSSSSGTQQKAVAATQKQEETKSPIKLDKAVVTKHIDGDTVYVKLEDGTETKVRFIGVNTPESTTKQEQYGEEASNYTKSQLLGKTVYLEKDTSDTDQDGRLLRYVWLDQPKEINENEIRTKMFNSILALNGYAEQSTYQPDVKYADYFKKFSAEARQNSRGLWAINPNGTTKGDGIAAPDTSSSSSSTSNAGSSSNNSSAAVQQAPAQQTTQSNNQTATVYITRTGKKYHAAGCRYLSKSQIPISLDEAKKSYEPCSVCNPPQ